jgi:hypothetical protein
MVKGLRAEMRSFDSGPKYMALRSGCASLSGCSVRMVKDLVVKSGAWPIQLKYVGLELIEEGRLGGACFPRRGGHERR